MSGTVIFAVGEIVLMIATVVLFFVGFGIVVKALKLPDEDEDAKKAKRVFMRSLRRCMGFLAGGLAAFAGTKLCRLLPVMTAEGYGLLEIAVQAALQAVMTAGFLLVIPYILMGWKYGGGRKRQD